MSHLMKGMVLLILIGLALAACAPSEEPTEPSSPLTSPLSADRQSPPSADTNAKEAADATRSASEEEQAVLTAQEALEEELKVSAKEIEVVAVEHVQFPDTSLGCPQPGKMYAQVITPGYKVILRQGKRTFDYRVSGSRVELCEKPTSEKGSSDTDEAQAAEVARKTLAAATKVPAEEIEVVSVEFVAFPDTSLGCPQPGMMYAQVITPGYKVLLRHGDRTYDFRVSGKRAMLCENQRPQPTP